MPDWSRPIYPRPLAKQNRLI